MKHWFKKLTAHLRPSPALFVVLVAVLVGAFYFFRGGEEETKTLVVERGEFVQEVSVSGKVTAVESVTLAFSETGRVSSIGVEVGDRVVRGQALAYLSTDALAADLRAARVDLQEIQNENAALVESAYRSLLSEGLAAVPSSSSYTAQAPSITGLYRGAEGTYRIRIEKKENSSDYEMRTFNLEAIGPTIILDDDPTPLGTHGLFVSFPDDLSLYDDTIWYITIPNKKSTSYLGNFNAYQEALRARDKAVANAQAEIENLEVDIEQHTLRAPFAGTVTAVDADVGAIVSSNQEVLSLISADTLEIESFVPEINLSLLKVGSPAIVTLDAYGPNTPFEATVISIDPAETIRDGVSTYRAILQFNERDERVRSGMTANVRITADQREGVIAVPQGAIQTRDGKKYAQIMQDEEVVEREVKIGAVSSLGSVEILSGLHEGDILVLP